MKAVVVYESMFGSTHQLAEAIAEGLRSQYEVRITRADTARDDDLHDADLLVAGAPTHAHSLSTDASRDQAAAWSDDPKQDLQLEEPEMAIGLREWLDRIGAAPRLFAAFDTRSDMPRLLTGAASVRIGKALRKKGSMPVVAPESFLVDKYAGLKDGEAERGRSWGAQIAKAASSLAAHS
jgi:hypothetical protein